MTSSVKIWFYSIDKFGYYNTYSSRSKTPPLFGKVKEIFSSLQSWSKEKSLINTTTYSESDGDVFMSYLLDMVDNSETGDMLLTLWIANPLTNNGQVAYVSKFDRVGSATTQETNMPEQGIPGYASYFWIIPSKNLIAFVMVENSKASKATFQSYVQNYLQFVNPLNVATLLTDDFGYETVVYCDESNQRKLNVFPRFSFSPLKNGTNLEKLRENISSIESLKFKTKIVHAEELPEHWAQGIVKLLKLKRKKIHLEDIAINAEVPFKPTLTELNTFIDEWVEEFKESGEKHRSIKFILPSMGEEIDIYDSLARLQYDLVVRKNGAYFDARSLLFQLQSIRESALSSVITP